MSSDHSTAVDAGNLPAYCTDLAVRAQAGLGPVTETEDEPDRERAFYRAAALRGNRVWLVEIQTDDWGDSPPDVRVKACRPGSDYPLRCSWYDYNVHGAPGALPEWRTIATLFELAHDLYEDGDPDQQPERYPVRPGAILTCESDAERCPPVVHIVDRYRSLDDDHVEYELADLTHTEYLQYRHEDLHAVFADAGLTHRNGKPITDERCRRLLQQRCEHSFHTVHRREDGRPWGERCISCRLTRVTREVSE